MRSEGHYLLRSNLSGEDPAVLWQRYIQLTEIEATGLNRMRIRDELARVFFDGLTGRIQFNSLRGSLSEPVLMTVKDGRWRRLD